MSEKDSMVKKTSTMEDHVKTLIEQAAYARDSADAMRFAQAALNAANAIIGLCGLKNRMDESL